MPHDLIVEKLERDNARMALQHGLALTDAVITQILYGTAGPLPDKMPQAVVLDTGNSAGASEEKLPPAR